MKRWFKTVGSALLASGLVALACTGESQTTFDQVQGDMAKATSPSSSAAPNPAPVPNPERPEQGSPINTGEPGRPGTPQPDASVSVDAAPDVVVVPDAAPDVVVVPDAAVGTVGLHMLVSSSPAAATDAGPVTLTLYVASATAYRYPAGVRTAVPVAAAMSFQDPVNVVADVGFIPVDTEVLRLAGYLYAATMGYVYFDVTLFGQVGTVGWAVADLSTRNTTSVTDYQSIGLGTTMSTSDNNEIFHIIALSPSTDYATIRAYSKSTLSTSVYPYSSYQSFPTTAGALEVAVY